MAKPEASSGFPLSSANRIRGLSVQLVLAKQPHELFTKINYLTVYRQKTDKPEFYSLLQWSKDKTIPSFGNVKCANGPDNFSKDDTAICVNSAENEPDSECIQYRHDDHGRHSETPFVPQCAMSPYAAQACTIVKTTMNYNDNTINFEIEDHGAKYNKSMLLEESIVDCGKGFHCEFNHTVAESRDLLFVSTGNANGEGDGTGGRSVCFAPISFQDFQVKTFVIFDDTVEVEWETVEDFSPGDSGNVNRFKAKIEKRKKENPLERTPPFTEARVACRVPHACYIYFIGVTETGIYDIYVQPYMDTTYTQLNENNIIKANITVKVSRYLDLSAVACAVRGNVDDPEYVLLAPGDKTLTTSTILPILREISHFFFLCPPTDGSTTERLNITSVRPVLRGGAPALSVCFRLGDPTKYDLDHFKVVLISPSGVWTSQVGGFRASEVEEEVEEEGTLVKERTSQKGSDGVTTSVYCSPDVLLEEAWSGLEESVRVLVLGKDEEGNRIAGSSDVAIPKVLPEEIRVTRITKTSSPSKGEEGTNTPAYLKFDFEGYDLKEGEQLNLTYFNQCEKPVAQYSASFVGNQEVIFQIDNPEVIAVGAEPVLIFTARKTDTDEPVAAGRVTYAPQDFSSEPLNFIEGEEVTAIRVQPSEADHIDFSDESCKDSVCYFLGATKDDIVTICKKLTDVEYCEETSASDTSSLEESPTMVLTRESTGDEVTLTLSDLVDDPLRSIDMVAWVQGEEHPTSYSPPGYQCEIEETNCKQVLETAPDGDSFKVLVTYVTNGTIESVVKTFQDYKVEAQQLMEDMVEVRWSPLADNANFLIHRNGEEDVYKEITTKCGNDNSKTCKGYFIGLKPHQYTIDVKEPDSPTNVVATEIDVTNGDLPKEIRVTRITRTSIPSKGEEGTNTPAYLKFAFEGYSLREGEQLHLTYFSLSGDNVTQYPASFVGNQEVIFQIDNPEVIAVGAEPVLIFIARKTDSDEPVAAGRVTYAPQDFSSEPLNFIEGEGVTAIRVQPSEAVHIDFSDESCKDSICYFLGATKDDIVTICKKLTDVEYCEETSASDTSSLEESPTMVLTREWTGQEVTLTLSDLVDDPLRSIDMVAWVPGEENPTSYSPPGYQCEIEETNCKQVLETAPDGDSFKVIVTYVTNDAIKSVVKTFLDYKVEAQQLMEDMVEVRWSPLADNADFLIHRSGEEEFYNEITTMCGNDNSKTCKGYFIGLKPHQYTIDVKEPDSSTNVVATEIEVTNGDLLEEITVTRITRTSSPSKGGEGTNTPAYLKFAFEGYSLGEGQQLYLTYFNQSEEPVTQYPASVVGTQEVIFQINNPEVIAVGAKPVLIFTARKTETDELVAAGRVSYAPQDLTTDLKSLKNDDGNKIIVRAVNDHLESYFIDLGKHKHPCKKGSACYHVVEEEEEEGGEHTVCVNATDTSTTTNRDFELCTDMNQIESPTGEFPDLVTTLTRPQGEQSPSMSLTSEKLGDESWDIDLLPYTDDDTRYVDDVQCQTTKAPFDCTRTLSKDPQLPFHVLMFDKSSSNWRDANFSDYKVEAQQLMEDMVEVRWWPLADNADFLIHRSGEEEFYNEITTMCGNDNSKTCKGYFIGLKHAHYTIDVREIALPTNVVETEIEVTNGDLPKEIRVTRITRTSIPSKGGEGTNTPAYLKFAFEGYSLREGEQLHLTYFSLSGDKVTQYPASVVGNQEVIFQIDNPEVIAVGAEPVLIFIARKTETDEPVAAGRVTYAPQDFSSEPLNFIEGEEVTAIRVQPSEADHIDFSDESCKDSVCYFLGATKDDIVTICKKLTDVEYCEETSASDTSSLEESPTMVLTREWTGQEVTLTLSDLVDDPLRSIDMVAWVPGEENPTSYSPPGYQCEIEETNCKQVLETAPDGDSFKVIVTYVTNDAIKSVVKTFQDFHISAAQFSSKTLEASWEARTSASDGNANFVTTLSAPEMAEENLSVSCGEAGHDTRCRAYFVQKEAGEYVVRISLKEDQKNQVAYRMEMHTLEEELEVTQVNNEAGSPLKLTVFFNNAPANDYHIVVVDTNGKWVSAEGTRSADDDTTEVRSQLEQHDDLELDSNFDIHRDVWVAVRTSEGKSGQANVSLLLLTSLQQVGEDAIEVQWNDLGDSYAIEMQWNDLGDSYVIDKTHNVECEKSSSPCHFVLHQPYDSQDASVEVVAQGAVMQKATRVTSLQKLEGMELSTPTLRFDHKVQVCFKDEGTSDSYLLVLEDGDTLLLRAKVSDIEIEGDRKCLISPSKFEVGALVSSWVLVTKFEGENVVRTGQTDWISFLLSANRYVRAAFNKQKELHVSWHLLEDFTEESGQYRLTVRKRGGVEFEDNFQKDQAAHTLTVENEGSYTACVKAMVKDFVSEEVCSSIVVLDINVEAPEIEKPEAFSSGGTAAMISWDSVEDATGYLVQWQDHSAGERQWNNGIVPPMVKGHARPQPLTSGEPNFVMVPPGVLTLEVDVSTSGDWDMCVAAVRDDMFGEEKCNKVSLGTGSDDKPDPPKNLQNSNNHISWEATEGPNIKYFVKWYLTDHPDSIAKSATTSETSMDFDPEEPGKWSISVFALNQKNVASDASKIEIQIQGITIDVAQVDARSLKVTWWETRPDTKKDNYEYKLTLKNPDGNEVFSETQECPSTSEDSPCALFAMGIDQGPDKVDVTVERAGVSKTKTITFLEFEEVKVRYQLRSSHNSTIIWSSVKGADMYNVSIFTDTEAPKLVFNQFRTIPTSCQFVTDLSVKGTYSTVQPCKDEHHCGARTGASPNESDDSTSDTAVFGSILAVLCVSLVLLTALVTFRLHKKKAANSSSSSEVELRPRDIPSFGTEPRLQRLQGRAAQGLPGFTEWQ
ncbi:uncharacterized protein LOC143037736 [Oratosquilla oratoria]|uniref:uncharacterized protein LOC143037736 n=1 Tax=Oratosquilla oratoria TaxID=337810 RepID=UPI003F76E7D6